MLDLFKRKLFKIIFCLFVFIALPFTILMLFGSQRYVYRAEVKINATAEIIFPYLYTPEKFSVWQKGVKSLTPDRIDFDQPGDSATIILSNDEENNTLPITIVEIAPSTHLITASDSPVFKTQTIWKLERFRDHSVLHQEAICFYSGVGRFMAPFLTTKAEQQLQKDLFMLRDTVERAHGN